MWKRIQVRTTKRSRRCFKGHWKLRQHIEMEAHSKRRGHLSFNICREADAPGARAFSYITGRTSYLLSLSLSLSLSSMNKIKTDNNRKEKEIIIKMSSIASFRSNDLLCDCSQVETHRCDVIS